MMDKIRERAQIQLLAREQRLQPFNWQNLGIALSAQPDPSIQNRKHYVDIEPTTKSKKFRGQEPVFSSTPSTTGPTPLSKKKSKHQTSNFQLPSYTLWFKAPLALRCPTTTCNDARYRATPKAKRGAGGRPGAGATGGTGGPGTTETTTSADGTSWDITGFEGLMTVKYQKQTLSNTFLLLFCLVVFCGIYSRIEENVSFYLGFEYHHKETLSLSQLFKTLRKTRDNIR